MARTYIDGMGNIKQKKNITWDEIQTGDILFNYGHSYEATLIFVDAKKTEEMDYTLIQWMNTNEIRIKKFTGTKQEWINMCDRYDGDFWNDEAYIYDHLRDGDDIKYMGDIIKSCFTTGVELE